MNLPANQILAELQGMDETLLEVGKTLLESLAKKLEGVEKFQPNNTNAIAAANENIVCCYLMLEAIKQFADLPINVELACVPKQILKDVPEGLITAIHIQSPDIITLLASIKKDTLFQAPKPERSFEYGSDYYANAHLYNQ